jgi:hypothetical protein
MWLASVMLAVQRWLEILRARCTFASAARTPGNVSARRAVDREDAPTVTLARSIDMVDAGDRAILDCKGERGFWVEAERQR